MRQETPRSNDRLLIHITSQPTTAMLIRRGRRVADYLHAECFAIYVSETGDLTGLSSIEREAVERHLNFARNLHIESRILQGHDPATTLVDFARRERITQIFVMRHTHKRWRFFQSSNIASEILDRGRDMQVTVVAERRKSA